MKTERTQTALLLATMGDFTVSLDGSVAFNDTRTTAWCRPPRSAGPMHASRASGSTTRVAKMGRC